MVICKMARGRGRGLAFLEFNDSKDNNNNNNGHIIQRPPLPPTSSQFDDCWDDDCSSAQVGTNSYDRATPDNISYSPGETDSLQLAGFSSSPTGWEDQASNRSSPYQNSNGYRNRTDSSTSSHSFQKKERLGNGLNKTGSGCFKCGDSGHFARDCNSSFSQSSGSSTTCYKCGNSGHFARECPMSSSDRNDKNDKDRMTLGGSRKETGYIPPPPPEDEETIFKCVPTGINFSKYDEIPVEVSGRAAPGKMLNFDTHFNGLLLGNIKRAKYDKPTPVQKNAIPIIHAGRDLMACAQTGSGKTAAFVLPVLNALLKSDAEICSESLPQCPYVLVVAPTRELAVQIFMDTRKFAHGTNIRSAVVYGGTSVSSQARTIRLGVHFLVGTPGRLLDFIEKNTINLSKVRHFILDEADRMLDMGFEPSIRKMIKESGMPPKTERQTLMFSATFPDKIQELAADFLNDYLFLTVGMVGGACTDVEQIILQVDRQEKRQKLCGFLDEFGSDKTLVFVEQKRNADFLASYLSQNNYRTTSIHGDRLQREREEALREFKNGVTPILIATSVAARGLDIPNVHLVVNYDLPNCVDEYVHRIGRTGRCGNIGRAISFYSSDTDNALAKGLTKILSNAQQNVPAWLEDEAKMSSGSYGSHNYGSFGGRDRRRRMTDYDADVGWEPISTGAPPATTLLEEESWD